MKNVLALIGRDKSFGSAEKRRFVRLKKHLIVQLRKSGSLLAEKMLVSSVDIGLTGMTVKAEKACQMGVVYSTEIFIPAESEPARLEARTLEARQQSDEKHWLVRLRFEAFEGDARNKIGRFLSVELRRSDVDEI